MRKCLVKSHFAGEIGPKAIGSFQRQFELIVEAFHHAAGIFLSGDEVVE